MMSTLYATTFGNEASSSYHHSADGKVTAILSNVRANYKDFQRIHQQSVFKLEALMKSLKDATIYYMELSVEIGK
jgi:hypothetical protein